MTDKNDPIYFSDEDIQFFRDWIQLNLESVTWQGRYKDDFEEFWTIFFVDGLSLSQFIERFEYTINESSIGPLSSWFTWLRDKFICYVFIYKSANIFQLSRQSNYSVGYTANIIRSFLLEKFPHLDEELSEKFQISNVASSNLELSYQDLINEFGLSEDIEGSIEDDIMPSMEVTLYDEWSVFLKKMKKDIYHPGFNISRLKSRASLGRQLKIIRDLFILIVVGVGIVYGVKWANKKYEKILSNRISVYEPQFNWLDKSLSFKRREVVKEDDFELDLKDIDEVDDSKNKLIGDFEDEERFDVESEVVLTSWDSLPKDFDVAELEQSEYEELGNKGYRESRYGNTKVYRVMMKSEDTVQSKVELNKLLEKYNVTQVDNVKPGMTVPGGIYYNLFVPREVLKEFMALVMDIGDAVLYESRTRTRRNPPGKNKVFIWVKSI